MVCLVEENKGRLFIYRSNSFSAFLWLLCSETLFLPLNALSRPAAQLLNDKIGGDQAQGIHERIDQSDSTKLSTAKQHKCTRPNTHIHKNKPSPMHTNGASLRQTPVILSLCSIECWADTMSRVITFPTPSVEQAVRNFNAGSPHQSKRSVYKKTGTWPPT